MRSLRAVKYRKKYRKLIILAQILAIWYVVIVSAVILTSDTVAYFSDKDETSLSITTGTWWDGSDLEINMKNTENIKECAPYEISVEVKNKGFSMTDSTEYEIYYLKNGNPKENGQIVGEGKLDALEAGESAKLTFEAKQEGSYRFKLYQRPGYGDKDEERTAVWSKKFMIKCLDEEDKVTDEEAVEEEEEAPENDELDEQEEEEKESDKIEKEEKDSDEKGSEAGDGTEEKDKKEKGDSEEKKNDKQPKDKGGEKGKEEKGSDNEKKDKSDKETKENSGVKEKEDIEQKEEKEAESDDNDSAETSKEGDK